ncbi:MAG: NUDIX domain-containing protein [Pseudomonadota bacterium]
MKIRQAANLVEMFDTYTEDGRYLGREARSVVHREGIWHRTVNVLLFNGNGELLLQQRSAKKDVCPLHWDLSVAEHLQPGESDEVAAARGLLEELGLVDVPLAPVGETIRTRLELPERNIRDFEMTRCFRGVSDQVPRPDPDEVVAIEYVSVQTLVSELGAESRCFTPWFVSLMDELGDAVS